MGSENRVKRPPQQPAQPAQPRYTNDRAPRKWKQHQQEYRPQQPTKHSDPTQHAKRRTGDCPGPIKKQQPNGMSCRGAEKFSVSLLFRKVPIKHVPVSPPSALALIIRRFPPVAQSMCLCSTPRGGRGDGTEGGEGGGRRMSITWKGKGGGLWLGRPPPLFLQWNMAPPMPFTPSAEPQRGHGLRVPLLIVFCHFISNHSEGLFTVALFRTHSPCPDPQHSVLRWNAHALCTTPSVPRESRVV